MHSCYCWQARCLTAFAQGSHPAQPVDPTAQAPATQAPTTAPTFPTSKAKAQPDRSGVKVHMGTIVKEGDAYVLKSANQTLLAGQPEESKQLQRKRCPLNGYARKREEIDSRRKDQSVTVNIRRRAAKMESARLVCFQGSSLNRCPVDRNGNDDRRP